MNHLLLTFALNFVVALGIPSVEIQHLHGGPRLNNPSYIDYYICCNVVEDTTLQWKVNGTFIGGFEEGETGDVLANSQPGFNYSAILLSSNASSLPGKFSFDSVLTLSFNSDVSLEVGCLSNRGSDSTTTINTGQNPVQVRKNVVLQLLFHRRIIQNIHVPETLMTYAFICGVDRDFQSWILDGLPFGFNIEDSFSQRISHLSADHTIANQAATFIARNPYDIISILFVTIDTNATGSSDMNVTCEAGNSQAQLPILDRLVANEMLTTTTEVLVSSLTANTTATDLSVSDSTTTIPPGWCICAAGMEAHNIITVAVVLTTSSVIVVVVAVSVMCFLRKRRKVDKDVEKAINENRIYKKNSLDEEYPPNTLPNDKS